MYFAKLHGLGNDFLVLRAGEVRAGTLPLPELARRICERHGGVGADGILVYRNTEGDPEAEFSVEIFNADGSMAEISGNGVRCLTAFLNHSGEHLTGEMRIRTVAGIKRLKFLQKQGSALVYRSSMGRPITEPARIPARIDAGPGPVLQYPLLFDDGVVNVTLCSMGNPHCSTFWPDLGHAPFERLGPVLEHHPCFPNRTNVEFVQVLDRHHVRVAFWERGVGPTKASGTGSSAAAVASILNGFVETPVTVHTDLGSLLVEWVPGRELFLTGPAEFVCSGEYSVAGPLLEPA